MAKINERATAPPSFEAALAELEKIVAGMEAGQLSLEDSLACYRRGAELLQYCDGQLQAVQSQVKVLEDGMLKDFTLDASGTRRQASSAGSRDDVNEFDDSNDDDAADDNRHDNEIDDDGDGGGGQTTTGTGRRRQP
ncbi:MAG: exodeoxyribonuclease VII small subunit [Proteobacteria bacterium]|nr:exodeoxyribonuclease VII small subunit [Burkholderiales bacterium]